jgi:hypothetical protein
MDLLAKVQKETAETLTKYTQGGSLSFLMNANIAVARLSDITLKVKKG